MNTALIKNIKKIINKPYNGDDFLKKGVKHRNISIYPIIIYTDKYFGLPGINNYLKEEFEKKVIENDVSKYFKCIKPLTFIDFNFFLEFVDKSEEIKLDEIIISFHNELEKRNKKFSRFHKLENLFSINDNFETVFYKCYPKHFKDREKYVTSIMNALNLTEGMQEHNF